MLKKKLIVKKKYSLKKSLKKQISYQILTINNYLDVKVCS